MISSVTRRESSAVIRRPFWAAMLTAFLLLTFSSGCQTVLTPLTTDARDWDFIDSVGGMTLGHPRQASQGGWFLPVNCNVSGLKTYTSKPTVIYSELSCRDVRATVKDRDILLNLRTCLSSDEYPDAAANGADLGELAPGDYSVYYANRDGSRHALGTITIPKTTVP